MTEAYYTDWQITLPNDHIWSAAQDDDGHALAIRLAQSQTSCRLRLHRFVAFPVDELGTVDVSFRTTDAAACGAKEVVVSALFWTMRGMLAVSCREMPSGS